MTHNFTCLDDCIEYLVKVTDPKFFKEMEFIDTALGWHDENNCMLRRIITQRKPHEKILYR